MSTTLIERAALAVLEEPGAAYVTQLVNTILRGARFDVTLDQYQLSLRRLLDGGLIDFSARYDSRTMRHVMLGPGESHELLDTLRTCVEWSSSDCLWKWCSSREMPEVTLTPAGFDAARRVLDEDGWFG